MKPRRSRKAELAPNAMSGRKSHAEAAESTEFKMTELGPIPKDWDVKRLGELWSSFKTGPFGSSLHAQDYIENGTPLINPMHIQDGKIEPSTDMTVDDSTKHRLSAYKLSQDDIVVGRRGEMGRAALVGEKENGWLCGTGCFFLHLKESCCPSYIALYLRTPTSVASLNGEAVGTTLVNLNQKILSDLKLPLPPLAEQRRIAGALSDVDELISALGKLIEKKRNIKTGAMQQLLTGKTRLPGFGAKRTEFKQTELGPIPVDWEVMRLGDVCTDYAYGTGAEAVDYDGENKYIRITDIDEDSHLYSPLPLASPSFFSEGHVVKENDLLVARTGASVGKTYFYSKSDGKLIFAGFLMKANVKHAEGKFIFYLTLTDYYKRWVSSESARSGQPGINIRQLQSLLLPLPPLTEQKAIAAVLSDMDAEIAALEADRAKYERIKSGMMQELLTGKTRLKGE